MRHQRLEVTRLDAGVLTGLTDRKRRDAPSWEATFDKGHDRLVREHLGGDLACVRGHENLSVQTAWGHWGAANAGNVKSRASHSGTLPVETHHHPPREPERGADRPAHSPHGRKQDDPFARTLKRRTSIAQRREFELTARHETKFGL
ncbi:hypothetical protein GCM10027020_09510 [Nocardioides salsibiostraticola]